MAVSTLLITVMGTRVTELIVAPWLGEYDASKAEEGALDADASDMGTPDMNAPGMDVPESHGPDLPHQGDGAPSPDSELPSWE